MRIALFTNGIHPYVVGGIQKHSFYLAKHLAQRGVDVDVYFALHSGINGPCPDQGIARREARHLNWIRVDRPKQPYFPGHFLWDSYVTSQKLLQAYRQHRQADFIYAQGLMGWSAIRAKRDGMELPPVGVNPHGLEMYQRAAGIRQSLENRMFRPAFGRLLRHADVALSLGGGLTDIMKQLGVEPNRIVESPNGVGRHWLVREINRAAGPTRFVFVGRFERRKGVQELQAVLERLLGRYEFSCDFIGPIPEQLRIVDASVTYWGTIRDEERVQEILRSSDVLICPSYSEGMPTVILEAMASGLAVIATRVGAVEAMVSQHNGWLISPGDPESLKRAMIEAIEIPKANLLAKKLAGRNLVAQAFTWEAVAQRTAQAIRGLLEPNEGRIREELKVHS